MPKEVLEYKNLNKGVRQDLGFTDIPTEDGYVLKAINLHYGGSTRSGIDAEQEFYNQDADNYALKPLPTGMNAHPANATSNGSGHASEASGYIDPPASVHEGSGASSSTNYVFHNVEPGYGLFYFSSDWSTGGADFLGASLTGSNFLVARAYNQNSSKNQLLIYSYEDDEWYSTFHRAKGANSTAKFEMPIAGSFCGIVPDGNLRICGNHKGTSASNSYEIAGGNMPQWFGYVKRNCFEPLSSNALRSFDGWYMDKNDFAIYGTPKGVVANTFDSFHSGDYPANGMGIHLEVEEISAQAGEGGWMAGTYETAFCWLYDKSGFLGQETSLIIPTSNHQFTISNDSSVIVAKIGMQAEANAGGVTATPARGAGIRVYYRLNSSDEWSLLVDGDICDGIRGDMYSDYQAWSDQDSGGTSDTYYMAQVDITNPSADTFTTINGFSSSEPNYHMQQHYTKLTANSYLDATVVNGRVFIGNFTRSMEGQSRTWGDRVLFSEAGRPDIAPDSNILDIVPADGDEITGLTSFADKLIVFKKKQVIIVDVSDIEPSGWFMESKNPDVGIEEAYSYKDTAFGVVWSSRSGAYLFDGKEITNLSGSVFPMWKNFVETWSYGDELITNGTMEADANWNDVTIGAGESQTRSSTHAHSGTYSRKVVSTGGAGTQSDSFTVTQGKTYYVEGWVKVTATDDSQVKMDDNSLISIGTTAENPVITAVQDWTKLSTYAKCHTSGSEEIKFISQAAHTFYVDDVSVKEATRVNKTILRWMPQEQEMHFFKSPEKTGTWASNGADNMESAKSVIYNFKNKSWTGMHTYDMRGTSHYDFYNCSNFINDHNGDAIWIKSSSATKAFIAHLKNGDNSTLSSSSELHLPETDFGDRFKRKKIYAIAVTHSSYNADSEADIVFYRKNGSHNATPTVFATSVGHNFSDVNINESYAQTGGDYNKTILKAGTPISCYTFQPIIKTTEGVISVKDVAIYYRVLGKVESDAPKGTGDSVVQVTS